MMAFGDDQGVARCTSPAARLLAAAALVLGGCWEAESGTANESPLLGTSRERVVATCITVENIRVEDAPIVVDFTDPTKANTNYGSVQQMITGYSGSDYRRILLKFKLGEAGVPPGSTVTSAVLTVRMIQSLGKQPFDVYQGTTLWNESTVTWNQITAAPGGGLGDHLALVPTLGVPNNTSLSVTLPSSLVETWIDAATNMGLVLDHPLPGKTLVAANEAPKTAPRPKLVVCYEPTGCYDGIVNHGEEGVDCGGPCAACPTCTDGIQNQGEGGVDCGGPCAACPTCTDGIQNQGEVAVDCGGPCVACPTCTDGIRNQGEIGADCGGPCPACSCEHDTCSAGGPLDTACADPCVATICAVDPFCCHDAWDPICIAEMGSVCGSATCSSCGNGTCDLLEGCVTCPADCGSCACSHDTCSEGGPLDAACADPCVATICAVLPGCCAATWSQACVAAVSIACGSPACTCGDGSCDAIESCGSCPADCGACPCVHDVCTAGGPLAPGCGNACASQICAADPFCCSVKWDSVCISAVQSVCGQPACLDCGDLACGGAESCGVCPGDCGRCPLCGNGNRTLPERCDDGNLIDGDGCSSLCQIECDTTEAEPNDGPAAANGPVLLSASPAWECGAIGAPGDVDYFAFTLATTSDIDIETLEPTGTECWAIDTFLRVYDSMGNMVAADDDSGIDMCSRIDGSTGAVNRLAAGTYFVEVRERGDDRPIPGYLLRLAATAVCGNGITEGSESCDDGNTVKGDGCSGDCVAEPLAETDCADRRDEDGDGLIDCGDPDCQSSCSGFCAPGQRLVQSTATGVLPQPMDALSALQSVLPVSTEGTVTRVAVAVGITHPSDGDLIVALSSPGGALAQLAVHRGGPGQNFTSTLFDSSCQAPVAAGAAPYTGCFAPDTHLGVFNGEASLGDWHLDISDTAVSGQGALDSAVLSLCVTPRAATGEPAIVTPTSGGRLIGGCPIFPSDNPWNTDISAYPVHSRSAQYMATIAEDSNKVHPGLENPVGSVVGSTQPAVFVECTPGVPYCSNSDLYTNGSPTPMPIPPDAEIENLNVVDSDRHVMVVDTDACKLYELFHAHRIKDSDGSVVTTNDITQISGTWHWRADSAAVYDLTTNAPRPAKKPASTASGLPMFVGLLRYEEVAAGAVNHALTFALPRTQFAFIAPATTYATLIPDPFNPAYPPMGLRLRLKASYDTSAFYGQGKVIVEAMKKYGLFVNDNGLTGMYPAGSTGLQSIWRAFPDLIEQLNRIPVSAFEVVDTGPIQY